MVCELKVGSNAPFRELTGYFEEEVLRLDWEVLRLDWRDLVAHEDLNKSEQVIAARAKEYRSRTWRTKSDKVVRVTRSARLLTFIDDKHNVIEAYIALVSYIEGQEKTHGSELVSPECKPIVKFRAVIRCRKPLDFVRCAWLPGCPISMT